MLQSWLHRYVLHFLYFGGPSLVVLIFLGSQSEKKKKKQLFFKIICAKSASLLFWCIESNGFSPNFYHSFSWHSSSGNAHKAGEMCFFAIFSRSFIFCWCLLFESLLWTLFVYLKLWQPTFVRCFKSHRLVINGVPVGHDTKTFNLIPTFIWICYFFHW